MRIGEVATRVGLSLRTIRHYHEVGLVVPSARSTGGFRLYTESDVARLSLIKSLKPLDFSLDQMRELLETMTALEELSPDEDDSAAEQLLRRLAMYQAVADSRVEVLRAQVQGLERLTRQLKSLGARARQRVAAHTK